MEFETILYKKENRIATITMNRPEKRNAQNRRMILEMDEAFLDAEQDDEIRVVILEGAGKVFSSGHDLKRAPVEEGGFEETKGVEHRWTWERDLFFEKALRPWRLKKPTIAKVQGHCVAGAFMVANLCDIIIAADNAVFGDPMPRMGSAGVECHVHPWVLPPRIAKEILFTGGTIDAKTALQHGMVNHVVPLEELDQKTMELAEKIAMMPPFALQMAKFSVNRMMDIMGFYNALNAFFDTHIMMHFTNEREDLFNKPLSTSGSLKDVFASRDQKFTEKPKS